MDFNKVNNTRMKKNNMKIKQEDIQRGKKRKNNNENVNNENFEKTETFFSEQVNENIIGYNNKKGKTIKNPIFSPSKPDKNKNIICNDFHSEARNSVPKSNYQRKKNNEYINDICIQIKNSNNNIFPKRRSNTRKKITEFNQQEIKNTKNNLAQKSQNKDKAKSKCISQSGRRNSKKINANTKSINNEKKEKEKEKEKEKDNKRRITRSYITRNNTQKIIADTSIFVKNKDIKRHNKETNKVKKEKRKRGIKEHKKVENNNNYRKGKSKSHMSNPTREKSMEIEKVEKPKQKDVKIEEGKKRDYSSPRNLNPKNYIDNSLFIMNDITRENCCNSIKYDSPLKINYKSNINKKLSLTKDYIYSSPKVDMKKYTITLKKNLIKNNINSQKEKDLFKKSRININENMLKRKRKRNPSIKSKNTNKEDNDTSSNYKKLKIEETKDKLIKKGKSKKNIVNIKKEEQDENNYTELDKLKNDLNCDRNKSVRLKGKKRTRKHKSMKKKQKQKELEQIKQEINSVDSFSEPDKNIYDYECLNYRNNNYKINNSNNAQNIQFLYEPTPSYYSPKINSIPYTTQNPNDINFPNSLINNNSNAQYINSSSNDKNNQLNTKPFYYNFDTPINNNNMLSSNSVRDLPSETANFMEGNNSLEYSFPLDFEEKIDIKEDKTYYAKTSKYIKYCPIDEYIQPISNQDKKPYRSRIQINHTHKLIFPKKKENKSNPIESDNDKTDITSSNNDYSYDLPSILKIPRIKPYREEHSKMIKDKLNQDGIKIYQTDNDTLLKEELNLYAGSFMLYDEKNNIKVTVPCYKENEKTKEFMNKKKLSIIEFQEDNDIDTDEEQLELEIERNNNALLNFMKKVSKTKNYVEKNLMRKRKV